MDSVQWVGKIQKFPEEQVETPWKQKKRPSIKNIFIYCYSVNLKEHLCFLVFAYRWSAE